MATTRVKLFKFLFACAWSYALYFDVFYQPRLGHEWYIYKLIMLTNINFVVVTIFSVLSAASALLSPLRFLKKYLDHSLVTTIFPSSIVTCGLFWGLYFIEPELVMPAWVRQLIPSWLNHFTHSLPIFYVFFELFAEERHGVTAKGRLLLSFLLVGFYFKVIFAIKYLEGVWLYPLLTFLDPLHFGLAFAGAVFGYFLLTQVANSLIRKPADKDKFKKRQ